MMVEKQPVFPHPSVEERQKYAEMALRKMIEANYPTQVLTVATIDSAIGRKLGMQKGKRYVIALLGEAE